MDGETEVVVGGVTLDTTRNDRLSFGLYGITGSGKTLGGSSFGGGEYGKIIDINVEAGPPEGGGGATVLKYASGIFNRIQPADVLKLDVRSWADMQNQYAWLRDNADALYKQGYRVLMLDSGTAMCYCIHLALTSIDPTKIKGNIDSQGREDSAKKNHKRELVPNLLGDATRAFEYDDYEMVYDRYIHLHTLLKALPFTFVTTFLEKEMYDEQTRKYKVGIGPKLVGRQLPSQMPSEFDAFIHCEQRDGKYVWLMKNDPTELGNESPYYAKHRFGNLVDRVEEADGVNLLKKLGVTFTPIGEEVPSE